MQSNDDESGKTWQNISGIRTVVAAFGILCGLTGIIAGYFEILQGNVVPSGIIISTIGSEYSMAEDFTYFAITIVPNFLITGILAITFSCLVIVWSVKFIDRKYGVVVLLVLTISQMLVGGGWVIDLAIMTCLVATRINSSLSWWHSHLPIGLKCGFSRVFPFSLLSYAIISFTMLLFSIVGINDAGWHEFMGVLAGLMFIPILLTIFGGIAKDL